MQKWEWEYVKLDVYYEDANNREWVKSLVLDCVEILSKITSSDAGDFILMLGKEGWEMVSEQESSTQQHTSYYFKRPIK